MSRFRERGARRPVVVGDSSSIPNLPPSNDTGLISDGAAEIAAGVKSVALGVEHGVGNLVVAAEKDVVYAGHYIRNKGLEAKKALEEDALKVVTRVSKAWNDLAPERKAVLRGAEELKTWFSGIYGKLKAEGIKITSEIHSKVIPIIENSGERLYRDAVAGIRELENFFKASDEDARTVDEIMEAGDMD